MTDVLLKLSLKRVLFLKVLKRNVSVKKRKKAILQPQTLSHVFVNPHFFVFALLVKGCR